MTPLRQRMIREMQLRRYAPGTIDVAVALTRHRCRALPAVRTSPRSVAVRVVVWAGYRRARGCPGTAHQRLFMNYYAQRSERTISMLRRTTRLPLRPDLQIGLQPEAKHQVIHKPDRFLLALYLVRGRLARPLRLRSSWSSTWTPRTCRSPRWSQWTRRR
jgi:hypothetical protein